MFSYCPPLSYSERQINMDNYFFNRHISVFPYRKKLPKKLPRLKKSKNIELTEIKYDNRPKNLIFIPPNNFKINEKKKKLSNDKKKNLSNNKSKNLSNDKSNITSDKWVQQLDKFLLM